MNLNTTSFFNSNEVHISSRMNEYMKKNFGYEVEGDIDTLREAKKSLEAEQIELKKHSYMNHKYMENMLMIETINSLVKAHPNTPIIKEDDKELEYGDTEEEMAKGLGMSQDDFWELAERVGIDQYGGLTKDNYEDVMNHIVDNADSYTEIDEKFKVGDKVKANGFPGVITVVHTDVRKGMVDVKLKRGTTTVSMKDVQNESVYDSPNKGRYDGSHPDDDEELITKIAEWIYHESSEPISEIEHLVKKADAVGEYMDAVSESKEKVTEKGPGFHRGAVARAAAKPKSGGNAYTNFASNIKKIATRNYNPIKNMQ